VTRRASAWEVYGSPLLLIAACIVTAAALGGREGTGNTDFLTFDQSGHQLLAGGDPYVPFSIHRGPNLNPPWVVVAMAPLALMPLPSGLLVWWAISFASLFASTALIARTVAPGRAVPITCAVLATQSAFCNVGLGQVAWPLMLLMTIAWWADRRSWPVLSGALLGVAASWKPFLIVFAPYLVWRREWRMLGAAAIAIIMVALFGFAVLGAAGYRSWIHTLSIIYWHEGVHNASLRGFAARVFQARLVDSNTTPLFDNQELATAVWLLTAAALGAATLWRFVTADDRDRSWASLTLLSVLGSPLGWIHYVAIPIGPLVATLGREVGSRRRIALGGWLLLCVPFLWLRDHTFGPWLTLTVASSYMWGTLLLLIAVLMVPARFPSLHADEPPVPST
jgi:alpha-1,2-mannosyltransferase